MNTDPTRDVCEDCAQRPRYRVTVQWTIVDFINREVCAAHYVDAVNEYLGTRVEGLTPLISTHELFDWTESGLFSSR